MLSFFLQGFLLGFPAAATPGPMQAFLLAQTMQKGWRRTLPSTLAPLLSDAPIIALTLFVLTQLPTLMQVVIQLLGGLFLLYLGVKTWQLFWNYKPIKVEAVGSADSQTLMQAVIVNLLNPNPYIFWSSVGGIKLLEAWSVSPIHAVLFIVGLYATLTAGFMLFVMAFGLAGKADGDDGKIGRTLIFIAMLALIAFAFIQLSGAIRLLLAL